MKTNIKGGLELPTLDPRLQGLRDRSMPGKDGCPTQGKYYTKRKRGVYGERPHSFYKPMLASFSAATSGLPPFPPTSLEPKLVCSSLPLALTSGEMKNLTEVTHLVVLQSDMKLIMTSWNSTF